MEIMNTDLRIIYLGGGCFWGVEHHLQNLAGVEETQVGYMGGHIDHPDYRLVCEGGTGHIEVVKVIYNPNEVSDTDILKLFFEIHDPTELNHQGVDIGEQYASAVFYTESSQKVACEEVMSALVNMGYQVVTQLHPAVTFWVGESYHQRYFDHHPNHPICHTRIKRFN